MFRRRFDGLRPASGRFRALAPAWLRPAASVLAAALVAGLLAACTPAYDWRTVTDASQGYVIDLPAKPTVDERQVSLVGIGMPMHVRAAHLDHAVYAVGVVDLPSADPRLQREVIDALRSALGRHLGSAVRTSEVHVPSGVHGEVEALAVTVSGEAGQNRKHKIIHAWLVAQDRHVYQAVIVADQAPPQEQIDQFFQSFKLF